MIKIFGKYRYHWQPELSWLIIYWSLAITPIFIAAALLFELYSVPSHILMLFTIFVALFGLGFHRYFIIEDHGILRIVSFNIFKPRKVKISDIEKVEVVKTGLCLIFKNGKKRQFYMRKWPKKYFLDALALHPDFKGEVELLDHMTNFDYFAFYEESKKPWSLNFANKGFSGTRLDGSQSLRAIFNNLIELVAVSEPNNTFVIIIKDGRVGLAQTTSDTFFWN